MNRDVTIRPAQERDVPLIYSFIRELAEYEHLLHEVKATEQDVRESLFGPRPYAEAVLGCLDGEPVGFALFFHNYSTFMGRPGLYLEDLYVRPQARRNGVGRKLFNYLARLAMERGCARLEWAVLNWNEPAIQFYRGLGAVPIDEWTVYRLSGPALAELAGPP